MTSFNLVAFEALCKESEKLRVARQKELDAAQRYFDALEADAHRLEKVCMVIDRYWNTFSAPCCIAFNEAMSKEHP